MASDQPDDKVPAGHDGSTPSLDANPNVTFEAVGRAISNWETLETHLAVLYSIFVGEPRRINILKSFGKKARIFTDRLRLLEDAARTYFAHTPDQNHEGHFDEIISEVRLLSKKRHQIAHGVVAMFVDYKSDNPDDEGWLQSSIMYAVAPPMYAVLRLTKGKPYTYGSSEVNSFASEFDVCAIKVREFGNLLERRS